MVIGLLGSNSAIAAEPSDALKLAQQLNQAFVEVTESVSQSVVEVRVANKSETQGEQFRNSPFFDQLPEDFRKFFEQQPQERQQPNRSREPIFDGQGSGLVYREDGIIMTNCHVVERSDKVKIVFKDGREYDGQILGVDRESDIAVVKIDATGLKPVKIGDSSQTKAGEFAIAIGSPFGLKYSVTVGHISAKGRRVLSDQQMFDQDFIQTDASINQGNSGGPLFNMDGDVVGINTAILGQSGSIGIGFSIPSNNAKIVIDQLIKYGETKRGWLGVRIQYVTKEIAEAEKLDKPRGALVQSVAEGSPSEKGGIKAGDIILEFNGKKINEMKELPLIVAQTEVGKTVDVKVWRNKREVIKKIKLGRLETSEDFNIKKAEGPKTTIIEGLKITVRSLTKEDIEARNLPKETTGAVITKIENDSPINYLNIDNIIVEAQKKKIKTVGDLKNIVNSAIRSSDKTILIAIYNNQGQRRYIGVKLD